MTVTYSHGAPIYYEVRGQGPAVLFCHGAGSNAATWWQQIPDFCKFFTCITYDHRCFGRSIVPQNEFIPMYFADDAIAVLDAAGYERAALICQSLGGITGLRFALDHPDRVSAFVSCDSPLGIDHSQMNTNIRKFLLSVPVNEIENRALSSQFVDQNPSHAYLYSQINQFNPLMHVQEEQSEWAARIVGLFEGDHLVDISTLAELACPTLFVVGKEDPAVTPAVVRELSQIVKQSEILEIENAGHSPYFEQPELFNMHVLNFLFKHVLHSKSYRASNMN